MYYHIQWLTGATPAYTWLNTRPPALIWEEMSKAYNYNARKLWVLNVGDIKPGDINFGDFVSFQPNQQNGKGVACWETIWLQWMNKRVSGFQTIFMVRREHDFSSVGTAPWRGLSHLIGISEYGKRLMSGDVSERIRKGAVYLDGEKVDPLTAPTPEGFYLATYEFDQKINRGFNQTDGHWEGSLAECLVYDGKLTQAERNGVEEYLRAKWLSSVHLER